jgi:hypothetical protein
VGWEGLVCATCFSCTGPGGASLWQQQCQLCVSAAAGVVHALLVSAKRLCVCLRVCPCAAFSADIRTTLGDKRLQEVLLKIDGAANREQVCLGVREKGRVSVRAHKRRPPWLTACMSLRVLCAGAAAGNGQPRLQGVCRQGGLCRGRLALHRPTLRACTPSPPILKQLPPRLSSCRPCRCCTS